VVKPGRIITLAALLVAGVFVCAFASQVVVGLGCALNENKEAGSELDRFCDGPLVGLGPVVVPTAVAMAGGAIAVWTLRAEPLVVAAFAAVLLLSVPYLVSDGSSTEAPDPAEDVKAIPQPDGPPVAATLPPPPGRVEDGQTTMDMEQVGGEVAVCLMSTAPVSSCDDPGIWRHHVGGADIRVEVVSRRRYRVIGRSPFRGNRPHIFRFDVDMERGRSVNTCTPRGTLLCPEGGRKVETFPGVES
jgi:hypothetical protein